MCVCVYLYVENATREKAQTLEQISITSMRANVNAQRWHDGGISIDYASHLPFAEKHTHEPNSEREQNSKWRK